eukprot:Tbor_TRINITY_DN5337_c3_g10::TRINITY_DN5337_c3_g10_i1::g.4236::m.4236
MSPKKKSLSKRDSQENTKNEDEINSADEQSSAESTAVSDAGSSVISSDGDDDSEEDDERSKDDRLVKKTISECSSMSSETSHIPLKEEGKCTMNESKAKKRENKSSHGMTSQDAEEGTKNKSINSSDTEGTKQIETTREPQATTVVIPLSMRGIGTATLLSERWDNGILSASGLRLADKKLSKLLSLSGGGSINKSSQDVFLADTSGSHMTALGAKTSSLIMQHVQQPSEKQDNLRAIQEEILITRERLNDQQFVLSLLGNSDRFYNVLLPTLRGHLQDSDGESTVGGAAAQLDTLLQGCLAKLCDYCSNTSSLVPNGIFMLRPHYKRPRAGEEGVCQSGPNSAETCHKAVTTFRSTGLRARTGNSGENDDWLADIFGDTSSKENTEDPGVLFMSDNIGTSQHTQETQDTLCAAPSRTAVDKFLDRSDFIAKCQWAEYQHQLTVEKKNKEAAARAETRRFNLRKR